MFTLRHLIVFDDRLGAQSQLWKLAAQTAACLLIVARQRSGDTYDQSPTDEVGLQLAHFVDWDPEDHVNALQAQAEWLYDFVELTLNEPTYRYWLDKGEKEIIAAALEAYQVLKSSIVTTMKKTMGEHWGDATEFNRRNWTDRNEEFLSTQPA